MALNTDIAQSALDSKGLAELRRSATADKNDQETLRQVAGQFESLFVTMMLKSMRQASLAEGIFDSSQSEMYQDMSDQQLAVDLSSKGGLGLQDMIIRQLGGQVESKLEQGEIVNSVPVRPAYSSDIYQTQTAILQHVTQSAPKEIEQTSTIEAKAELSFDSAESFVQQLWSMAKQAADKIGVKAEVLLSQAALETGWGKHVINKGDGQSSHNLFNIKADRSWQGDSATKGTVEYRDGIAVKEQAQFRSYDSYQDSFDDYVEFLQTQPRYRQALEQAQNPEAFIEGLHKAGYATDPNYSDKIKQIMNSDTLAQISQDLKYS